jgi:hypothetical protein
MKENNMENNYVYVLEVVNCYNDDINSFIHDTEESAIFAAICEMDNWFKANKFDTSSNVKEHQIYVDVKDLVDKGNYHEAIYVFDNMDDEIDEHDLSDDRIRLLVYRKKVFHVSVNTGIGKSKPKSPVVNEIPCPHCGKMNDVDATHCWSLHCGRPLNG